MCQLGKYSIRELTEWFEVQSLYVPEDAVPIPPTNDSNRSIADTKATHRTDEHVPPPPPITSTDRPRAQQPPLYSNTLLPSSSSPPRVQSIALFGQEPSDPSHGMITQQGQSNQAVDAKVSKMSLDDDTERSVRHHIQVAPTRTRETKENTPTITTAAVET